MSNYIFKFPEGTPELTFDDLAAWLGGQSGRAIGTTVVIAHMPATETQYESIDIELYGLVIARLMNKPGRVEFPSADDPHLATTEWIAKVVRDNCVGTSVYRIRRSRKDPLGPPVARGRAGLLVIDGDRDKQVFGRMYPVSRARIAKARKADARRQVEWAAQREQYTEESRQREAMKTYTGPEGSAYASDADSAEYHWRVIDTTFRDGGCAFDVIGYVRDDRDDGNAPAGYLGHLIHGSLEADDNPLTTPYEAFTKDGELIDAYHDLKGALAAVLHEAAGSDLLAGTEADITALEASVAELTGQETGQ